MLNKNQRLVLLVLLTRFSTSLSSSRNLSSSFTHCGNSFSPWLWACSNCSLSSLSTEISWTKRSCQVLEACRSSSRSSEVRIRRSVPKDLTEGWKRKGFMDNGENCPEHSPHQRPSTSCDLFFQHFWVQSISILFFCLTTESTNSSKSYKWAFWFLCFH